MKDLKLTIDKSKTLCVSGHRSVKDDLDRDKLEIFFNRAINKGFNTFLVGMAVGYDTICFQILERKRDEEKKDIKIIACIPCPDQDKFFSDEQKKEYRRMINSADERVVLSDYYTKYCMIQRNRYMVDNSSVVMAYLNKNSGGTYSTVKYALEKKVKCVILPRDFNKD